MRSSIVLPALSCVGIAVALVAWMTPTPTAAEDFKPLFKPSLEITRTVGEIRIDGNLDEPAWKSAAHIDRFHERTPGDNTRPDVQTDVYLAYSDEKLYVAFDCRDDPSAIRATMSQRDQWSGDDAVVVFLDTYSDATWAYQLYVNPYGIQKDMLRSGFGPLDLGFDLIWESAARRTPTGYTVEMAIPFSSIRFPDQDLQSWRMDFWRSRPREVLKQYSWAANDRADECLPCQWGTVMGIKGVRPGRGLEILPSTVAHQTGEIVNPQNPS